ncbi:tRNA adenosine(34) deaminase TadA [Rhodohalobacter sulfatireducens]|uniref:tRNA-specific adenosine deaminase n=1 Tax=Rhodohalobacter sulfatireducens TaxID=2911366 RepID=A0ABS9KCY8_9BACT|nr:tRNA adenosine(34) deaminase TadA [Rhodohalobacter sulfatireducens]MCG2588682.1 tRNA adenosine(34) deaminase TadA [Rhodohalobacter sulfatireducens]
MFNGKNIHQNYMMQAFKQAEIAFEKKEVPVGAVVVHENRIIGRGYNQVEMLQDSTAHAEMIAISAACSTLQNKYLDDCTLYVTLEPCPMCAGALVWSKLKRVVFGTMDEKAGSCGSVFNISSNKKLNHSVEVIQGVMEADCKFLLKEFFRSKR